MGCEIEALSEVANVELPRERDNPHAVKNNNTVEVNSWHGSLLTQQHKCDTMATGGFARSEFEDNPPEALEPDGTDADGGETNTGESRETNNGETGPTNKENDTEVDPQPSSAVAMTNPHKSNGLSLYDDVKERSMETLEQLEELENELKTQCINIPSNLLDVSLICLKPSTVETLSYHLDPESDVLLLAGKCKDYRGMAEWVGLENVFIKYVSRLSYGLKTLEVLSKWQTQVEEPLPTIGNLQECLLSIDRPDVLEDMSSKIALDAVARRKDQCKARKKKPGPVDTSWQLTRHDVMYGTKTMYTACLMYAYEDERMAQLIIKLYKTAYKDSLFFLAQFDLKRGKYELETTAQVIDERCDKKVVFLLSEYFYASSICQFAVNYVAIHGTGNGNLIPFHLTRNITTVPNVLKGIAGIRWFRKGTRCHMWGILTHSLLADKIADTDLLLEIKESIRKLVDENEEIYLQDPPYDADVEPAGKPIEVSEPEGSYSMPSSDALEYTILKIEEEFAQRKRNKWKFLKQIRDVILKKVWPSSLRINGKCTPSQGTHMVDTTKIIEMNDISIKKKTDSTKCISETQPTCCEAGILEDSLRGAVGGSDVDMSVCNDHNNGKETHRKVLCNDEINISKTETTMNRIRYENMIGEYISNVTIYCRNEKEVNKLDEEDTDMQALLVTEIKKDEADRPETAETDVLIPQF